MEGHDGKIPGPPSQVWGAFDQATVNDPYPVYAAARKAGPVQWVAFPDGRSGWLVTGYEEVRRILTDPRFFKDLNRAAEINPAAVPPGLPPALFAYNMLSADPPDHTRLRSLVAKHFTPARAEALRPRIEEITGSLLDAMEGHDQVDLIAVFAFPLPIIVICELLGVPSTDREFLRGRFARLLGAATNPAADPEGMKAGDHLRDYFAELLVAKRRVPGNDLVSGLVSQCDAGDDRLTEAELLSTVFLLVLAGHETTVNLIGNGAVALLRHPDQLAALRADPSLIPQAVEELLRFDGPVQHGTSRFADEDVDMAGVTIRRGDPVAVLLSGANRDLAQFVDGDVLDVTRSDNRHLAFGHGIHFCLGAPLARLEGIVAFTALFERFPDLGLAVDVAELRWRYGMVLRSLLALPVQLHADPTRSAMRHSSVESPAVAPA